MKGWKTIPLEWELGYSESPDTDPTRWVPARVPGCVQLDWSRAEGRPEDWWVHEPESVRWMQDVWWTYRARFPEGTAPLAESEYLYVGLEAVEHGFDVLVDGELALEGAVRDEWFRIDQAMEELRVRLHPAPAHVPHGHPDYRPPLSTTKSQVGYGWDFHPILVPLGICGAADVRRVTGMIDSVEIRVEPRGDRFGVEVEIATTDCPGATVQVTLHDPTGQELAALDLVPNRESAEFEIAEPHLWWPHTHGEQPLYTVTTALVDADGDVLDQQVKRIGLRTVRIIQHPGAWNEWDGFPQSRNTPPITLEVNGVPIFAKGSNWVPADIFPSETTPERHRALLELAKGANMNLLRMWGGAQAPRGDFYDTCDELGIMVWQEFSAACARTSEDPDYLAELEQHALGLIDRLRHHVSLILWCGGNELYNAWSRNTEQLAAMRLLASVAYQSDPVRPYLPTSPIQGVGHGGYLFRTREGEEVIQQFNKGGKTAYNEFGVGCASSVEVLRACIPAEELWPPRPGGAWQLHHAFRAWDGDPESWLNISALEHYFGPSENLEELVERSQMLQGVGLKYAFEEARRQGPKCSMALNWCFNDTWPCAANNSLVAWPVVPKPGLAEVGLALRSHLASLRYAKFSWAAGETLEADLWLLGDDFRAGWEAGEVEAWLVADGVETLLLTWHHSAVPGAQNLRGPTVRTKVPAGNGLFEIALRVPGNPGRDSHYRFLRAR